nr:immunoglobulin heavy chain junction region [Mus musculus]
TAQRLWAT